VTAALLRHGAAALCALALTACATTGNGRAGSLTAAEAAQTLVVGKSSRADVNAALGDAHITRFDNGYELWLYQVGVPKIVDSLPWLNLVMRSSDNAREVSVLFDPSGLVKKYQVRDK